MNKDNFTNYRFWYLLGAFVPLWLLIILFVMVDAKAKGSKEREANQKAAKDLEIPDPKNQSYLDAAETKKKKLLDQKEVVWQGAWLTQQGVRTWPDPEGVPLQNVLKDAPFGEPIQPPKPEKEDLWRRDYRRVYKEQFDRPQEFTDPIKPAYFKDNDWQRIMNPVTWVDIPTNEECWLAQEDFWVRRELLRVLKAALDNVGRFKPAKKDDPAVPRGAQRFRNPNWELDLILEEDAKGVRLSPESTIKNIHVGKRPLSAAAVRLHLRQTKYKGKPVEVAINADTVAYNQTIKISPKDAVPLPGFRGKDGIEVEQVFNWTTAPIRRIDRLEVGTRAALGHRTFADVDGALKARDLPDNKQENAAADAGTAPRDRERGEVDPAGPAADPNRTPNGLNRYRYIGQPNKQVAKMPVGLVLIVDQAYLADIEAAFVNSRLDFVQTQFQLQHTREVRPPTSDALAPLTPGAGASEPERGTRLPGELALPGRAGSSGGATTGTPDGVPGPGGFRHGGFPSRGGDNPEGYRPEGYRPGSGTGGSVTEEADPNLVELALYGTIKLYEPYRPAKKEEEPK